MTDHSAPTHDEMRVPRPALYAATAIILFSLAAAYAGSAGHIERVTVPEGKIVAERTLRLVPQHDKSVIVTDYQTDKQLGILPEEEAGFINGVLRGLSHERRLSDVPVEVPYRLVRNSDGRHALIDMGTMRRIELRGFGDTNDAIFPKLMTLGSES